MRKIDNLSEQSRAEQSRAERLTTFFLWYNSFLILDQVKMSGVREHKHVLCT